MQFLPYRGWFARVVTYLPVVASWQAITPLPRPPHLAPPSTPNTSSLPRPVQDRVPAFSADKAEAIIERELGAPVGQLFAEFDRRPIAAASLGQVGVHGGWGWGGGWGARCTGRGVERCSGCGCTPAALHVSNINAISNINNNQNLPAPPPLPSPRSGAPRHAAQRGERGGQGAAPRPAPPV